MVLSPIRIIKFNHFKCGPKEVPKYSNICVLRTVNVPTEQQKHVPFWFNIDQDILKDVYEWICTMTFKTNRDKIGTLCQNQFSKWNLKNMKYEK